MQMPGWHYHVYRTKEKKKDKRCLQTRPRISSYDTFPLPELPFSNLIFTSSATPLQQIQRAFYLSCKRNKKKEKDNRKHFNKSTRGPRVTSSLSVLGAPVSLPVIPRAERAPSGSKLYRNQICRVELVRKAYRMATLTDLLVALVLATVILAEDIDNTMSLTGKGLIKI